MRLLVYCDSPDRALYGICVNMCCIIKSIIVLKGPVIEKEAEDIRNVSLGSTVEFSIVASGDFLEYVWKRGLELTLIDEDSRISGVTSKELVIANVSLGDAGVYVCAVSNSVGFATSNATLAISEFRALFE